MFKAPWRALSALALLAAIGCGDDDGGTEPEGSISVSASPSTLTLPQGGTGTVTVTLTRGGGFAEAVNVTVEGLPNGVTASVSPTSLTGTTTQAVVTVNVASTVAAGTYPITVRASATGIGAATAQYTLTVTAAPTANYTLSATPATLTINPGGNAQTTVNIARTNFTGTVNLTLDAPPAGITASFNPAAATGNTSTATINVAGTVAQGTHTLTIKGTATGIADKTTTVALTVGAAASFTISASPAALTIAPGANSTSTVTIVRTNFTTDVALTLVNPPPGITGTFTPAALTGTTLTSSLQVNVAATVAPGTYPITVQGAGGSVTQTTTINVTVPAGSSVTLAMQPTALSIQQGSSGNATLNVTRTNFTGNITPSVTGAPAGMTVTFNPNPITANTSQVTVNVGASVAPNTYNLTITGAAGAAGNPTTMLAVTVTAPSGGQIVYEFCNNDDPPLKFWRQSGGTWAEVSPTAGTGVTRFSFDISGTTGGIAWVRSITGANVQSALRTSTRTSLRQFSRQSRQKAADARARLTNQTAALTSPYFDTFVMFALTTEIATNRSICSTPTLPTQVSKAFTVSGMAAGEVGQLSYGDGTASLTPTQTNYNVMVTPGTYDYFAAFGTAGVFPSLATNWTNYRLGRGEATTSGAVAINRTGAPAFVTVPFTITGGNSGSFYVNVHALTGANGAVFGLPIGDPIAMTNTGNMLFLASNDRLATDMNSLTSFNVEIGSNFTDARATIRNFGPNPPASTTFALPQAVPAFTVTQVGGAPVTTWTVAGQIPTDYQTSTSQIEVSYTGAGESTLYSIVATRGWLTANNMSTSYTLTGPTLPGFLQQWAPAAPLFDQQAAMFENFLTVPTAGTILKFSFRLVENP